MKNDKWFLGLCKEIARNSKCLSRQIGAIIVKENRIISTGYNGPPVGVPHCNERYKNDTKLVAALDNEYTKEDYPSSTDKELICPRYMLGYESGEGLGWCIAGHAERNSIVNAAMLGVSTNGCKMYMDCPVPCSPCLIEIINAGISEIIFTEWKFYDKMGEWLIKNSNLKARTYEI